MKILTTKKITRITKIQNTKIKKRPKETILILGHINSLNAQRKDTLFVLIAQLSSQI